MIKNILDLGCGRGAKISKLQKKGHVTGIDISLEFIEDCRRQFTESDFYVMDGLKLNFPKHKFDEVYCLDVIEHVDNPSLLLKNIFQVLKSTGILFLDIPYFQSEKLLSTFNQFYAKQSHHQTVFSFPKIISLLNNNQFKINKCSYTKFFDNIYLLSYFLQGKFIQNQQGDIIQKTDTDQLLSYITQYVYLPDYLTKIIKSDNYSRFDEISHLNYHLSLIDLINLAKISNETISPIFPKTISLVCKPHKNPLNTIIDLTPALKRKDNYTSKYSSKYTINKLTKNINILKKQNSRIKAEINIIKDSKLFKLYPIYKKIKTLIKRDEAK
jgi:SAM-dependent methyltransferase